MVYEGIREVRKSVLMGRSAEEIESESDLEEEEIYDTAKTGRTAGHGGDQTDDNARARMMAQWPEEDKKKIAAQVMQQYIFSSKTTPSISLIVQLIETFINQPIIHSIDWLLAWLFAWLIARLLSFRRSLIRNWVKFLPFFTVFAFFIVAVLVVVCRWKSSKSKRACLTRKWLSGTILATT